jgi:S1-C subfamily serine protease
MQRLVERLRTSLTLLAGGGLAFLAMLLYLQLALPGGRFEQRDIERIAQEQIASVTPSPPVEPVIYARVRPSVVLVIRELTDEPGQGRGIGSGVVIDANGTILTSEHVVSGLERVRVRFFDGSVQDATVQDRDLERDLALLRVGRLPDGVEPATLGGGVSPGDPVLAIGSPFGFEGSVSKGVVSGLGRRFQIQETGKRLEGMIQFDAAVNPGNSGGPLVDMGGRVVGIVTGIANPAGGNVFIGLGFAVPIQSAAGIVAPVD